MTLLPGWLRSYRRDWLSHDVVAGLIVWSVVTPQAVAYAQIAGPHRAHARRRGGARDLAPAR
jgi:MFS superfamily sulfate permease-like transporter